MSGSLPGTLSRLDAAVFHRIINFRWTPLNYPMMAFSHGGSWAWVCAGFILAALVRTTTRRRGVFAGAYQSATAVGLATLLADVVAKPFIGRTRPFLVYP